MSLNGSSEFTASLTDNLLSIGTRQIGHDWHLSEQGLREQQKRQAWLALHLQINKNAHISVCSFRTWNVQSTGILVNEKDSYSHRTWWRHGSRTMQMSLSKQIRHKIRSCIYAKRIRSIYQLTERVLVKINQNYVLHLKVLVLLWSELLSPSHIAMRLNFLISWTF